jgi:hypothetical protein
MKKLALSLMVLGLFGFSDAYAAAKAVVAPGDPTGACKGPDVQGSRPR